MCSHLARDGFAPRQDQSDGAGHRGNHAIGKDRVVAPQADRSGAGDIVDSHQRGEARETGAEEFIKLGRWPREAKPRMRRGG